MAIIPERVEEPLRSVHARLEEILRTAGCEGSVHALDIDSGVSVGLHAERVVVAASVFKVAVALEVYRQAAAGDLRVTDQA